MATGLKYYFGIDFGTTNSATVGYVVMDEKPEMVKYGDEEGRPIPSVVAIDRTTGIMNVNCPIYYQVYPHAFCDVYVHNITTCISGMSPVPVGAKTFGDVSIWSGITIRGFAAVDKDTF